MPRPRPWLRHPPATRRPHPCPTGLPRFASLALARQALPASVAEVALTAIACDQCGGAHLTATPTEGDRP